MRIIDLKTALSLLDFEDDLEFSPYSQYKQNFYSI
jgi:hypothetical protein